MKSIELKTKRLIIRPYKLSDYKAWKSAYSSMHPKQNEWDLGPRPETESTLVNFKKILQQQKEHRTKDYFFDFAIFEKNSGCLIGTIALMDIARGVFHNAYLGYRIFNPYWKQGFGKEAVQAIFQIGFGPLKLHRIEAGIAPANRRSQLLAKSMGMRKEGMKKKALYLDGQWQDITVYAITCEDLKKKFQGDLKAMSFRLR